MSEKTRILTRAIEKSKSDVTVLFTDIVDSTKFWDKHGDTAGRLMLDLHNTLLFPVVKAFRGAVIKTIGDSIMASFKSPGDGVRAAIAMQQRLRKQRRRNKRFDIHIRIGVHTGSAIVEANDVYGDMVNVSARVESAAGTDEILVSQATAARLRRKKSVFGLTRKKKFVPKGKRKGITVWVCEWGSLDDLTGRVRRRALLPPNRRQLLELGIYLAVSLVTVYFLYVTCGRYLLADVPILALYLVTPHPVVLGGVLLIAAGLLALFIRRLVRRNRMPLALFKLLKGGFGMGMVFFPLLGLFQWLDLGIAPYWNDTVFRTEHAFVEVVAEGGVRARPKPKAKVLAETAPGDLYIRRGVVERSKRKWDRVLVRSDTRREGFLLRRRPARIGVPAAQLTETRRFVVRYYHLYAFALGMVGFFWGVLSFRLRPL